MAEVGYQRTNVQDFPRFSERCCGSRGRPAFLPAQRSGYQEYWPGYIHKPAGRQQAQGAVPLHQPLARTLFLTQEKTFTRKIKGSSAGGCPGRKVY